MSVQHSQPQTADDPFRKAFYIPPDHFRTCRTCGAPPLDSIGCILNDHAVDLRPFHHEGSRPS